MMRWQLDAQKVVAGLNATTAVQHPIMEACMRPGPLSISSGAINSLAQVTFDRELEQALQIDANNSNNLAETAFRAAGTAAHITTGVLTAALGLVVASFLPHKCPV